MRLKRIISATAATLIAATVAAFAGNTTFFTSIGDLVFPFTAPTKSAPGTIDNMTIGATTPKPGNFTTLTSTSAPSGTGITALFASPPPIGSTTPGPGVFSTITNRGTGFVHQGTPNAQTVSATLTAANLQTGIITVNQGAAGASALQLPLATAMDTAFSTAIAGDAFDFSVINISTNTAEPASLTTNTGWTLVGDMDVIANNASTTKSAGRFRATKTGTGAWTLYRLS